MVLICILLLRGTLRHMGVDYAETFSHFAKIGSMHILISLAGNLGWPLFQLDVKNAFLHGDLDEEVYMEKPPRFVAQGEKGQVCLFVRLFTAVRSLWGPGSRSLVMQFSGLVCIDISLIIQYFSIWLKGEGLCWLCILMIFTGMTLNVIKSWKLCSSDSSTPKIWVNFSIS